MLSGLVASAAQIALSPRSTLPLIGASGAIAGVLGAFLVLFPQARLAGVLPLGCLVIPMKSRAFLFIPFWFLLQLYGALSAPPGAESRGAAAWPGTRTLLDSELAFCTLGPTGSSLTCSIDRSRCTAAGSPRRRG